MAANVAVGHDEAWNEFVDGQGFTRMLFSEESVGNVLHLGFHVFTFTVLESFSDHVVLWLGLVIVICDVCDNQKEAEHR